MCQETAGDPVTGVLWTRRSTRSLAEALTREGHPISAATVHRLLRSRHYGLRANRKRLAVREPADRDALFGEILATRRRFLRCGEPVLSIDSKRHVLIGPFATPGRVWTRTSRSVRMYDYAKDAVGVAIPFGIYDVRHDRGDVVVGRSKETSEFAGAALHRWWERSGQRRYPRAQSVLLLCDSGGANDIRRWAWKVAVQRLADATALTITVAHYPTGASKWNPIEHKLFSRISATWAARPLESYEHVLKSIRATRTASGHRCGARLDRRDYRFPGRKRGEPAPQLRIQRHPRFPKNIYTIRPRFGPSRNC